MRRLRNSAAQDVGNQRRSRSVRAKADARIALDLLDERDLPGEIVARMLAIVGRVVVGLVPDVVALGRGSLDPALGRPAGRDPSLVSALQYFHLGSVPQLRDLGRGEM